MSHDIESILIVNKYLTCCKLQNPNSKRSQLLQRYLTSKISKMIDKKNNPKKSILYYLSIFPFLIR